MKSSVKSQNVFRKALLLCSGLFPAVAYGDGAADAHFKKEIQPILINYCYDCHGDGIKEGGLQLDSYATIADMVGDRDRWEKIRNHIDFRLMPPPEEFAPEDDERTDLVKWIDDTIFPVDAENPDPGQILLRRLNRTEYQNTIRDLLGVEIDAGEILPPDDSGYGFDNIGDVLTVSPVHIERYLDAARVALDLALDLSPDQFPETRISAEDFRGEATTQGTGLFLGVTGQNEAQVKLRGPGKYRVKFQAGSMLCGDEYPKLEVKLAGKSLAVLDIPDPMDAPKNYSAEVDLEAGGEQPLIMGFLNNLKDPNAPDGMRDRNILIENISVEGPMGGSPLPKAPTHRALLPVREKGEVDQAYFDRLVGNFLSRAFRRPVAADETIRYRHFLRNALAEDENVEFAIKQAMTAALVSPSFLFRDEPLSHDSGGGKSLISEYALASRLSYFLWSSMPDDHLLDLAGRNELRKNLEPEIKRMMDSPKSEALIKNFFGQWLQLRDMSRIVPGRRTYAGIDRRIPGLMQTETEMLIRYIIAENLPISTLLNADFTFLNEKLAKHYGIEGVTGPDFRKVSLANTTRRGLLGQGSFLMLTSHQTKTSPVLRGKYMLENILNTPPPPAPPNIPALGDGTEHGQNLTMRQELERHREDPACSSCHALMDPIGFGLENYDVVGRWRDSDNGKPIDPSGTLVTGQKFASAVEMRDIFINEYEDEFHRSFAVKMLTYAMGRGVKYFDRPAIDAIVMKGEAAEGRFLSWVTAIAESVPFQYRRN